MAGSKKKFQLDDDETQFETEEHRDRPLMSLTDGYEGDEEV
jgi:hypothetical protein